MKSHPAYGYFVGDVADIKEDKELLEGGYVEPAESEATKEAPKKATKEKAVAPNAEKATE